MHGKDEELLTNEEIEAILAAEQAMPPPEDQAAAPPRLVEREPGEGHFGKWIVWLIAAFILAGAITPYL
jgi:hypothetical protein